MPAVRLDAVVCRVCQVCVQILVLWPALIPCLVPISDVLCLQVLMVFRCLSRASGMLNPRAATILSVCGALHYACVGVLRTHMRNETCPSPSDQKKNCNEPEQKTGDGGDG